MELDHITVTDDDRKLIAKAVAESPRVFLAPMDKGLSGSSVWQAKWMLPHGSMSKLSVFKIGKIDKIKKEFAAMQHVASSVGDMPANYLHVDESTGRALLHLQFQGAMTAENTAFSFRNYIRKPLHNSTEESVCEVIRHLFQDRMKGWHQLGTTNRVEKKSIASEVKRWDEKIDLVRAAQDIGYDALDADLKETHGVGISELVRQVDTILREERSMRWGPIHGDLHAANVNLDDKLNVYLIDYGDTRFGWRALDFIILEAAIKFAASPSHAPVTALLHCERQIDAEESGPVLEDLLYGKDLKKIVRAAKEIRTQCRSCGAEPDIRNYRAGLICVAAAFTSIEWLVNRRFLFHSIAYQLKMLSTGTC